jgi:hypothetical protein
MIESRTLVLCLAVAAAPVVASAADPTPVAAANPKAPGLAPPNVFSPELRGTPVVQGSHPVENPATVALGPGSSVTIPFYGFYGDGPMVPVPCLAAPCPSPIEATKSEPDKNTYLVISGLTGADPHYDYGRHFLFQGHELGPKGPSQTGLISYLTRVNLDADDAHKITLLASTDVNGKPLPAIDGSTWDPFAQRLLFTAEAGANGGVWAATLDFPAQVEDVSGALGRGGYEGIQNDSDGNIWIVEDVGGAAGAVNTHAKQPNSFIYRFTPKHRDELKRGRLQVLQVLRQGQPIVFHPGQADADILSDAVKDLRTYGKVFETRWITIHDTDVDGDTPFDSNALAKANGGTPFKRPENALFRPGSGFREFVFDETGDTNALTEAGSAFGGFGSLFRLIQRNPSASRGEIKILFRGDVAHTGLDNVAFWSDDQIVAVEDAGDGLHAQRNALDSAYIFDLRADYSNPAVQPLRILAQGRDVSATLDSALGGVVAGFQNEGDNEITGFHISDGDPGRDGILGARTPHPFRRGWRVFYTGQHGDNITWEILRPRGSERSSDEDDEE